MGDRHIVLYGRTEDPSGYYCSPSNNRRQSGLSLAGDRLSRLCWLERVEKLWCLHVSIVQSTEQVGNWEV
jgi:hypothetical protein